MVLDELEDLIRRINRTNAATRIGPEDTITDALARRDVLRTRPSVMTAADAAVGRCQAGADGKSGHLLARGGQREGFDSPMHNAAQHGAQVTGHITRHTTTCRSTTMRAGTGNSTLAGCVPRRAAGRMLARGWSPFPRRAAVPR